MLAVVLATVLVVVLVVVVVVVVPVGLGLAHGAETITGAWLTGGFTVNVALALVALPTKFDTTTVKVDPLSAVVVAGVV